MDNFKKILKEQYANLPEELKKYIFSDEWKNILKTIKLKSSVGADMSEIIDGQCILVLFGLESYKNFKENLVREGVAFSQEKINALADEIDTSVFKPVRNSLDEVDRAEEKNAVSLVKETLKEPIKLAVKENPLNKESVLHGIENPIKTAPAFEKPKVNTFNIIDDKLNNVVKLPRQEERGENKAVTPTQNKSVIDPYREQIG